MRRRIYPDVDNEDNDEVYYCWECERKIVEHYGETCDDCIIADREANRRRRNNNEIYEREDD